MSRTYLALAVLLLSILGCNSSQPESIPEATNMPTRSAFNIDRCYPYVVPKEYVSSRPDDGSGLIRPLGHGLFVVLVQDQGGMVQNVTLDELQQSKTSVEAAHTKALENLQQLFASGEIKAMKYERGPHSQPYIVIGPHWAAAACVLLPGIRQFAQKHLGKDQILASVPHRDVMLLFQKPEKNGLSEIRQFVVEHESDGRKPLTFDPFELGEKEPTALDPMP